MNRPTFLMAEVEPPEGVSARELVLETGKFNVITAYSGKEAITNPTNCSAYCVIFSATPRTNAA